MSANVDRAARKKQIADGLRDIERKGKQRVSLATGSTRPEPVKSEFRQVVEALSLGMTLPEAVERMAQRVPITETNFFSIVIAIQGKSGGNLSEAMGNLSRVLRERKKMKGKITAMSMEAKASAAIIGAVPFLVVGALYFSSPNYVSLLWTTSHGRMISEIAICWMAIGIASTFRRDLSMLDEIVAKFSDAHFLAILFAAIGSAATVLTAAMPWLQPDTLSRRIKAVSSER